MKDPALARKGSQWMRLAGVVLVGTLAAPALGQSMDLAQLLSGKDVSHNLKLKDLNTEWRRLSIGTVQGKGGSSDMMSQLMQLGMMSDKGKGKGADDAAAAMMGMSLLGGMFGGASGEQAPVHYTRGQTMTVGGETFLVAYRYQKPETNLFQVAMEAEKGGKEPDFGKMAAEGKLTPESPLALSLINIKTISTLNDIRPFDMDREIAESGQGGGGLMNMIMQQAAKEAAEEAAAAANKTTPAPKPAARPPASRKPAPRRR